MAAGFAPAAIVFVVITATLSSSRHANREVRMVANARPATIEDLDRIPDDGNRYELLNGVISMADAPTYRHQLTVRAVFLLINTWVEEFDLGETLFAPLDVVLDDQNSLQPDILYIDEQHLTIVRGAKVYGAPQLIVEVISPGSRSRDSVEKPMRYALAGSTEYWLVDPELETIAVFALVGNVYVERAAGDDGIIESTVLPGLTFSAETIFATVNDRMGRTLTVQPNE